MPGVLVSPFTVLALALAASVTDSGGKAGLAGTVTETTLSHS